MEEVQIIDFQELEIEPIKYNTLLSQIKSVTEDEKDLVANLANASALLMQEMQKHWIGFYLIDNKNNTLVLGPFQGPLACTRIPFGEGVCGRAWSEKKTLNVSNVHKFDGHIACSAETKSEVVVPILKNNVVVALIDVDSALPSDFDDNDVNGLEAVSDYLSTLF